MKKVILFITLFSMISLFSYSKDPVKQWGQLQVKGNQLCSQTGDSIVLRGVSYGWHNLWPRFYNGNYTLFTLIFKKFTFMIITFKLFVIFAPNIQIRLDFSNHCNDIK